MKPVKPGSKDLAPVRFRKAHPEEVAKDYQQSKQINNLIKKYPEWDVARTSAAAELVVQKRELHDGNVRLQEKRAAVAARRKELDKLWKDLEDRERDFQFSFVQFNTFVKENESKKLRAQKQIAEERALIASKNSEIVEMIAKYDQMSSIRSKMDKNIKDHWMYEKFLMECTEQFPMFRSADSILDRYEALAETRMILGKRQETDLRFFEKFKTNMLLMTDHYTSKMMGLNNMLADLEMRHGIVKNETLNWETMVAHIQNTLAEKLEDFQEIKQSIWTIYQAICKRKEIEVTLEEHDLKGQLLFVKNTLRELKKVIRIVYKPPSAE